MKTFGIVRKNILRVRPYPHVSVISFSFENANIFIRFQKYFRPHDNVRESFSVVRTKTDTRFENVKNLLGLQNYPTKHLYTLV